MKLSYSKLVVRGVIATTLLMSMSCQKKGSARGVQPQTSIQTETNSDGIKDEAKDLTKIPGTTTVDPTEVTPMTTPAPVEPPTTIIEPKKKADVLPGVTSGDQTKVAPQVTSGDSTKAANDDDKYVTLPTVTVYAKVKSAAVPATIEVCSVVIKKNQTAMDILFTKIVDGDKNKDITAEEKEANYSAYYKLCLAWNASFVKENITMCQGKKATGEALVLHPASWNKSCYKYSLALKEITQKDNSYSKAVDKARADQVANLKALSFSVAKEAREMFAQENLAWKMFIVEGEIQTDGAKLIDAIKSNKVACSMTAAPLDKYTGDDEVTLSITGISAQVLKDDKDQIQSAIELAIDIKTEAKDVASRDSNKIVVKKAIMSCTGLDAKNLNVKKLENALGKFVKATK